MAEDSNLTQTQTKELEDKIKKCDSHFALYNLWKQRKNDKGDDVWPKGKLMEYLIVRAFELESKKEKPVYVSYPHSNRDKDSDNKELEQLDGTVHVMDIHALIECKDYQDNRIEIEPLVKLRFRLQVRPSSVIGIFFSCTKMTKPAEYWIKYMAPQLIIFWDKEDLEYCLENQCFVKCLESKYRKAIDDREFNYPFSSIDSIDKLQEVSLWQD